MNIEYLAGFIDGEGNFFADEQLRMSPQLDIANTNYSILLLIADFIEEYTSIRPRIRTVKDNNPSHSTGYHLIAGARILRLMLEDLISSLIIKKDQALAVREILDITPTVSGPGHKTDYPRRAMLARKIKWLNQGCK